LISYDTSKKTGEAEIICLSKILINGEVKELSGNGNGPINAFVQSLEQGGLKDFKLTDYRQHSIGEGSATESAAYVQLQTKVGRVAYGCGIDSSIEKSGLIALVSAYNRTR
jgi:2-isopropylmalate synthase